MKIKLWVKRLFITPILFSLIFGGSIPAFAGDGDVIPRDTSTDVQRISLPRTNTNGLTGALTYNYPIVVPPGRGKLTPDINFTYSNQNYDSSGIYGYGWSDNIPYIERQNKRGVENMYSDYYFFSSLSGELASTSATEYSSKNEDGSFYKYTFSNNAWVVKDKLGYTYTFGTTTSARQNSSATSSDVYRWMLEEVRDPNDNYVKYEYTKDNGQIYPYKITYTGNGVTDGPFEIEFLKQIRSDISTSTKAFFPIVTNYRIYEIYIKVGGTWVRKYNLAYSAGHNGSRSLLTTINDFGRDDSLATTSLPATTFSYQTPPSGFTETSALRSPIAFVHVDQNAVGTDIGVRPVDINGDGLTDIIQSLKEAATTSHAYINTGSGYFDDSTWYLPIPITVQDNKERGVRFADINGDGLTDVLQSFRDSDTNWYRRAYINNGHGFTDDPTWYPPLYFTFNFFDSPSYLDEGVQIFDINGDGLNDIVQAYDGLASTTKTFINTGNGFVEDPAWDVPVPFLDEVDAFWQRLDNGVRAFDVNGDGLTDIIQSYSETDPSTLVRHSYINNGHGFTENSAWNLPIAFMHKAADSDRQDLGVRAIDANSDGLLDIVKSLRDEGVLVKKTHLNTGSGFAADNSSFHAPRQFFERSSAQEQYRGAHTVDVNGDGVVDVIERFTDSGSGGSLAYINNVKRADILNQVNLNTGGTLSFTYKASPLYLNSSTTTNPSLPLNIHTLEKMTTGDGLGGYATTTYSYAGGSFYFSSSTPLDRRFAGFASSTESNPEGNKTTTFFHQGNSSNSSLGEYSDHVSKIGRPYRIEKKDQSDNTYAIEVNKWDKYNLGTGIDFVKLTQKTELTYDGDGDHKDKAENYSYIDTNGNLVQKISWGEVTGSTDGSFSDTGSDKFTTAINYATDTPAYILALPSQETITDQSAVKVKETKYYYDTLSSGEVDDGNLTKEEKWKANSTYIDTEKTYNGYGLVTQEKDPRDKITTYSYDSYNLYPATSTNAVSQATALWYDYSIGKPNQVKDANGYVFQTIYDGLDRVTSEKQPDQATPSSLVTKTSYTYTDNTVPTVVQKTENLDGSIAHDTYSYIDGLGRLIQERKESESSYSVKDFIYNSLSLIAHESLPYFSSGSSKTTKTSTASLYVNYLYDALSRVTAIGNAVGTTTNAYDDWKLTVTDPNGEVKNMYKDAYGQIVKVEEINGVSTYTTNYEYNGNNKLTKITDADSNVRNFTYDGLNRRLTAEDLHDAGDGTYGIWSYVYDNSSNIASSTDPKGQVVEYTYDDINRPLTENYTGIGGTEISYGYDSCVGGASRRCVATTTDAVSKMEYNTLGLVKKETKTINSVDYITQYEYDRLGNQTKVVYPDNSEVSYEYNYGNLLEKVRQKENGGSFADVVSDFDYSPTGKVAFKDFENAVTSTYTYDATKLYRLTNILTTAENTEAGGGLGFFNSSNLKKLFTENIHYLSQSFASLAMNSMSRLAIEMLDLPLQDNLEAFSTPELLQVESVSTSTEEIIDLLQDTNVLIAPTTPIFDVASTTDTIESSTTTPTEQIEVEELQVVVDPDPLVTDGLIKNSDEAKTWREYHKERVEYLSSRTDLPLYVLESAQHGKDKYEKYLLEKGFTTEKDGEIKTPVVEIIKEVSSIPLKALKWIAKWVMPQKVYAYLFEKEDFESCSSLPCTFTTNSAWGSVTPSLDSTSRVSGVDSLKEVVTGEGGGRQIKTGFSNSEIWVQFKVYIPSPMNFGASGYTSIFGLNDSSDNILIWINIENYGTARLIVDGNTLAYTDTGLNLTQGAINTIELRAKMHGSSGDVDVWLNNSTEGSPSYNGSGSLNTGTATITKVSSGLNYAPENGYSTTYFDDIVVDNAFIGVNIAPNAPSTLLAEGSTDPTNITDNTPEFSAIYHDTNSGDSAKYYRLQVSTTSAFTSTDWDSGTTTMATTTQGSRSPDISYAGSALASSTTYYWRVAFSDLAGATGAWSTTTSTFTLAAGSTTTDNYVATVQNISYVYDATGNITGITDLSSIGAGKVLAFTYDDLHRLTFASSTAASSTPFKQTYAYSAIGNMTGLKTNDSATSTYSYSETGYTNPSAATSIDGTSLAYDTNGNITSYGTKSYTWDYRNRMTASGESGATTTYAYDHIEQRVKKISGGVTTVYPNKYYNVEGSTITKNIFAGGELVAVIDGGSVSTSTPALITSVSANGTPDSVTTSSVDTTGADLVVVAVAYANGATPAISDSKSNTWTPLTTSVSGTQGMRLYYAENPSVGSGHTFSNTGTSNYSSICVAAFSGIKTSSFDTENGTTNSSSTIQPGSVTPAVGQSLIVAGLAWNGSRSTYPPTIDSSFTVSTSTNFGSGNNYGCSIGFLSQFAASAVNPTWDLGSSQSNSARIAVFKPETTPSSGTTTNYIHADHLGSTNATTDEIGNTTQTLDYYPYGSERIASGTDEQQRTYIGQYFDDESDLSYLNARYYEGSRGQFLSQDPVFWEIGQSQDGRSVLQNPQAQNSYSYAQNNPIVYKDPTGRYFELSASATGMGLSGAAGVRFDTTGLNVFVSGGAGVGWYGSLASVSWVPRAEVPHNVNVKTTVGADVLFAGVSYEGDFDSYSSRIKNGSESISIGAGVGAGVYARRDISVPILGDKAPSGMRLNNGSSYSTPNYALNPSYNNSTELMFGKSIISSQSNVSNSGGTYVTLRSVSNSISAASAAISSGDYASQASI